MPRHLVLIVATIGFMAFAAAGSATSQELPDCPTPAPSDSQQFSGTTATVTDPFVLPAGVFVVAGSHQGAGNFAVWIYDETGARDLLFNEIGLYEGETTMPIETESRVILDVEADGAWEISVESAF